MDLSYGYANARVKGMKSKLLDEETLRGLCSATTFNEFVNMLESTPYKQSFVNASTHNEGIRLVMAGLRMEFESMLATVKKVVPASGSGKVSSLISLWELKPLQVILAAKAAQLPVDQSYIDFLDKSGKEKAQVLVAAQNFGDALVALGKVGYPKVASKAHAKFAHTKDYKVALRIIGKHYYENLAEYAKGEPDPLIRGILQAELDYFNTSTALRLKNAQLKATEIARELVAAEKSSIAAQVAHCENVQSAVALLAEKLEKPALAESFSKSKDISEVELEIEKKMFAKILSVTRMSIMSLGTVIGYIYLKRREIENLRAIAVSLTFPKREGLMCRVVYTLKGEIGVYNK
ncbi:MAG: V-type ATPase subunit [Candidatus Micrarchaeia archaeon]|jgi:V/A-type H+-transporting ATPase subunit C